MQEIKTMDTRHVNIYLNLIEALLHCAKGEEWLLLQQHEELIDTELLRVMAQVAEQLNAEGNATAAKFLHYWTVQLTHLLQQNTTTETPDQSRAQSYLQLIQTLLGCSKGDEVVILSQHPDLMDDGLVYTMNQVAAQLAAKGNQDIAIYLKHLAADVNRVWLHPSEAQTPISSPPPNGQIDTPIDTTVATANKLDPVAGQSVVATAPASRSSQPANSHIEELLERIAMRLERLEVGSIERSTPSNPLWYMPILEQVDTHAWIISSEEVEQLIGIKPHCAPGDRSFVRGCWKFIRAGKIGTHSSWRVVKEIATLPSDVTPEPEGTELEPDLSSPWSENS
jgi:hypothetical protein